MTYIALCARDDEKQTVFDLLHSERFVDKTSYNVYYTLLDQGEHYCSPRTRHRLLFTPLPYSTNSGIRSHSHH